MNVSMLPVVGSTMPVPAPRSETDALLAMIERAARDPSVDIVKLEKLMEMGQRARDCAAEQAFNEAMSAVQSKMRAVSADANNPQTCSKYASYFALDKAIRPIYCAEGIAISFNTEAADPDHVRVVCYVTRGSYTRKYHVDLAADGKGAKGGDVMTKTHAAGSAFTYGQRYLFRMIFNVAIGDDDDGNAAGTGDKISLEQLESLIALADEVGADKEALCRYFKVESMAEITVATLPRVVAALNKKKGTAK